MTLLRRVIGRALRRARRNQGKTLRDVADSARVSIQYLSEVERGRKEASSEVLAAICSAHGWTLLDLLDEVRSELRADARAAAMLEVARPAPAVAPASIVPASRPVHGIAPSAGAQVRLAA